MGVSTAEPEAVMMPALSSLAPPQVVVMTTCSHTRRRQSWPYDGFQWKEHGITGERFKNTCELLDLRALKFSPVNKIYIFQCTGRIFCVEFHRYPLKFHTNHLTHTSKDMILIQY